MKNVSEEMMRKIGKIKLSVFMCIFLLAACSAPADPWIRLPGKTFTYNSLSESNIYYLQPSEIDGAVAILRDRAWRALTYEEADKLAQHKITRQNGMLPYLVRSLSYRQPTGGYDVFLDKDKIFVSYGMLGKHDFPVYHEAIIVMLAQPPSEIYVACKIAE